MLKKAGTKETTYLCGDRVPAVRYHIFKEIPFLLDGFSTRRGGVSTGQFESLNFSVKMGDMPENVKENFRIFTKAHGFFNPVMTDQTHTTNVKRVYKEDGGKNVFCARDYENIDGFVTDTPNLTLVTSFADCVPLYFADTEHRAIGLAHSGWRGTIGRIGKQVVEMMEKEFHTLPQQIKAAIGPSICVSCYEVDRELACAFAEEFQAPVSQDKPIPQDMEHVVYLDKISGKYYLNLWAANYQVLRQCGILEENIAIPDICTCCNEKELFSHRASKGKRGNLCAFLMIEE